MVVDLFFPRDHTQDDVGDVNPQTVGGTPKGMKGKLPDGWIYIEDFASRVSDFDINEVLNNIRFEERLEMRLFSHGRPAKRTNAFLSFRGKFPHYNYPAFQKEVFELYQDIDGTKPALQALLLKVDEVMKQTNNHIIVTKYERKEDCIPFHSDETSNWVEGAGFAVFTVGGRRQFRITELPAPVNGRNPKRVGSVVCQFEPAVGSLLITTGAANQAHCHEVLKFSATTDGKEFNTRTSIVFRSIAKVLNKTEADEAAAASRKKKGQVFLETSAKRKALEKRLKALVKQQEEEIQTLKARVEQLS